MNTHNDNECTSFYLRTEVPYIFLKTDVRFEDVLTREEQWNTICLRLDQNSYWRRLGDKLGLSVVQLDDLERRFEKESPSRAMLKQWEPTKDATIHTLLKALGAINDGTITAMLRRWLPQVIRPALHLMNTKLSFCVDENDVKKYLDDLPKPVFVLSVLGLGRAGKSESLNIIASLLDANLPQRPNFPFQTSDEDDPCTFGIDCFALPREQGGTWLFLDVEGLENGLTQHHPKLLAIVGMLSSVQLYFMTDRFNNLTINAVATSIAQTIQTFPKIATWPKLCLVINKVTGKLSTDLKKLLTDKLKHTEEDTANNYDRSIIRQVFPDCQLFQFKFIEERATRLDPAGVYMKSMRALVNTILNFCGPVENRFQPQDEGRLSKFVDRVFSMARNSETINPDTKTALIADELYKGIAEAHIEQAKNLPLIHPGPDGTKHTEDVVKQLQDQLHQVLTEFKNNTMFLAQENASKWNHWITDEMDKLQLQCRQQNVHMASDDPSKTTVETKTEDTNPREEETDHRRVGKKHEYTFTTFVDRTTYQREKRIKFNKVVYHTDWVQKTEKVGIKTRTIVTSIELFHAPSLEMQLEAAGVYLGSNTQHVTLKHKELYKTEGTHFSEKSPNFQLLKRAVDPIINAHLFESIPEPNNSDWLAEHHESGQTFENYVTGGFNKVGELTRNKIYLVPLGDWENFSAEFLQSVEEYAIAFFTGMQVKLIQAVSLENKNLVARINHQTQKRQYRTKELLEMLNKMLPSDAYCICGITFHDLYPEESWSFVFGFSDMNRAGVCSFARYDPAFFGEARQQDYEKMKLLRTVKIMTHQICFLFRISRCIYYNCLMNGINTQEESDQKPSHECLVCLRKIHFAIRFDIEERYKNLMSWFKTHQFSEESAWMEKRIKILSDHNNNSTATSNNENNTARKVQPV